MNDKTKQRLTGQLLYVILAILVLSIVCIAIAVSLTGGDQTVTPPPEPASTTTTQAPPTSAPDSGASNQPEPLVFQLPLQGVVSRVHDEEALVFSPTMEDYRVHLGIDVTANVGTAVRAVARGTIKHIYTDPFMGVSVVIEHEDGLQSVYQNLSETLPSGLVEGVTVAAGDVIGAIGETASREIAQEPHLHLEMIRGDAYVDPLDYLDYDQSVMGGYEE